MTHPNVDVSVILPILRKIPLFQDLDEENHRQIIDHIVLMYYPKEYTIFKEGEAGDALYIIKKGNVVIFHPTADGTNESVAEIGENGFFGEMSLISDIPRNASAKTMEEAEIFILSKQDFKMLLNSNPNLSAQISATVVSRTNENNNNQK